MISSHAVGEMSVKDGGCVFMSVQLRLLLIVAEGGRRNVKNPERLGEESGIKSLDALQPSAREHQRAERRGTESVA